MTNNFIIVSGYHNNPNSGMEWFFPTWLQNTLLHAPHFRRLFIVATSTPPEQYRFAPSIDWIQLAGNLGNFQHILSGEKKFFMPGCPAVWMIGMWLAYANECDFIYKEQDTLAFGPWVERLYAEIGDKKAIFGTAKMHGISTVLFLVKHEFIPQFVYEYLEAGPETVSSRIAEAKVRIIEAKWPQRFARHTFGYDGDRPFNPDDQVFMVQKLTPDELQLLADRKLVWLPGPIPKGVPLFSNHNATLVP